MKNHNELRELLPLAAAGALAEHQALAVRQHVNECAECKEIFERWEQLAGVCAALPPVPFPDWLTQKTLDRVSQSRQAAEDRRWNCLGFTALAAFSWAMSLLTCSIIRSATGIAFLPLLAFVVLFSGITAVCAALILRAHLIPSGESI